MTVTVITGASSGIGRGLALSLAARGEKIVAIARRKELLDALVAEIEAKGGAALAIQCDVTRPEQVADACTAARRHFGEIDRLIANAGGGDRTSIAEFRAASIAEMLSLNVAGTANCIEAVLPAMLQRGQGHIVVMSSLAGSRGLPGAGGYSAAKAALTALSESLRPELKARGIALTILAPGFVRARERKRKRLFEVPLADAVERLTEAILARKRYCAFPWQLVWLASLLRILPDPVYDTLAARIGGLR